MIDESRTQTDKELAAMERRLKAIYSRASREIGQKLNDYLYRQAVRGAKLQQAIQDAKSPEERAKALKEYNSFLKSVTLHSDHFKALVEGYAKELYTVNETAMEYVNGKMPQVYAINYNYTAKQIEAGTNNAISFELVNKGAVKELILAGDKSLLPYKKLDPAKDIPWNMRAVNNEVLQGILQGEGIPKIAKRLLNVGVQNRNSAIRAARTLTTKVENKGSYDVAKAAEDRGIIVKKRWIATDDNRTREWHMEAWDEYGTPEKAIPIDEPFIVHGEELMFAGDDSQASAGNVYNCRCKTPFSPVGFKSTLPPEKRGKIHVRIGEHKA